jgi:hypothetical protein
MTRRAPEKDLVILTADKNAQFALRGLITRHQALKIRQITADFYVHPGRDPDVLRDAHGFLRSFLRSHRHALVVLDREGCGREESSRAALEAEIEQALQTSGWDDRGRAVVIDPELEIWVWSDSPYVASELGWDQTEPTLRQWLQENGFLEQGTLKPARPKEALAAVLRTVRMPRSSAIYRALAEKVGLSRCTDQAFEKLQTTLRRWFPVV